MTNKSATILPIYILLFPGLAWAIAAIFLNIATPQDDNQKVEEDLHSRYHSQVLVLHSEILREQIFIERDLGGGAARNVDWSSAKTRLIKTEALATRYAMAVQAFMLTEELAQQKSIEAFRAIVDYLDAKHAQRELPEWKSLFNAVQKMVGDARIKEWGDLVMWWLSEGYEGTIEESDGKLKWFKKKEDKEEDK